MQLERLKLFAELVKKGSFTRTAEHLGISKAHLSKQIKVLETELQTLLIIRNTRTMRLTSAGENLFEHANKLTTFWHDSKQLLASSKSSLAGEVRFTAPTGLLNYKILPMLNRVSQQYPDISIKAETGNKTHNLVSNPYDFAVRIINTPPQEMVAKKLTTVKYVCCATPEYLSLNGTPCHPRELKNHTCIALSYWKNWLFKEGQNEYVMQVSARYQFSDNEVVKRAALSSMGICRLPEYMLTNESTKGSLIPLFQNIESEQRNVYLLYPQSFTRPERVNIIMRLILDRFNEKET
jgi:DNA-binding transcriptional LysR family regulator